MQGDARRDVTIKVLIEPREKDVITEDFRAKLESLAGTSVNVTSFMLYVLIDTENLNHKNSYIL